MLRLWLLFFVSLSIGAEQSCIGQVPWGSPTAGEASPPSNVLFIRSRSHLNSKRFSSRATCPVRCDRKLSVVMKKKRNTSGPSFDDRENENLDDVLQEIQKLTSDSSLSQVDKIMRIRELMPPPLSPEETEPGMRGETLVAKSFGHLNDLLFLDSWDETNGHRPLKL
eukprot:751338-Hanusia_phi.AAC.2